MRVGRGSACKIAGELRWGCKAFRKRHRFRHASGRKIQQAWIVWNGTIFVGFVSQALSTLVAACRCPIPIDFTVSGIVCLALPVCNVLSAQSSSPSSQSAPDATPRPIVG